MRGDRISSQLLPALLAEKVREYVNGIRPRVARKLSRPPDDPLVQDVLRGVYKCVLRHCRFYKLPDLPDRHGLEAIVLLVLASVLQRRQLGGQQPGIQVALPETVSLEGLLEDNSSAFGQTLTVPDHADTVVNQELVYAILRKLPPPEKMVLYLRYYQGMTLEQISQKTKAPLGTVKSTHYRALRNLLRMLHHVEQ